jgi:hypothetical protein
MFPVLLPIRDLARKYGIPTPAIDALVLLAEVLTGKPLNAKRAIDFVAIDGESVDKMHERLNKWLL